MECANEKQELADQIADILELVASWFRKGKCNKLSMNNLNQIKNGAAMMLDVSMDYEDIGGITKKTYSSIVTEVSRRSMVKPTKRASLKLSEWIKVFPNICQKLSK